MPDLDKASANALEPSVQDLLSYRAALDAIERMSLEELRSRAGMLAHFAMVVHPATVRWLAREAAGSLGSCWVGGEALAAQMGYDRD
jgi:hypothetical protein